jgi:hypothetical protein
MGTYLCNFASGKAYKEIQKKQFELFNGKLNGIFSFTDEDIRPTSLYNDYKDVFDSAETGWGYCIWKPYILLLALTKIPKDDVLVYSDVADEIFDFNFFHWANDLVSKHGYMFLWNYYKHSNWTKRDCFVLMDCDNENYWEHLHAEAGTLAIQNTEDNKTFLRLWLYWCRNRNALTKIPNICGLDNLPGFIDHRTDQSILTNLLIANKFNCDHVYTAQSFIHYNKFEEGMNLTKHQYD